MRAVLLPCVCVMAAGCDALFNLDHVSPTAGVIDAPRPADDVGDLPDGPPMYPPCATFGPRLSVQMGMTGSHDPTLSSDRRELFFTRRPVSNYQLIHAVRADTATEFGAGTAVTELNGLNSDDTDPALTADGLMIVFKSTRGGNGNRAYQATRTTVTSTFSTPVVLPDFASQPAAGVDLSPDGLTIYIYTGSVLLQASRATRTAPFSLPLVVGSFGDYPSMSPDGLAIYYNSAAMGLVRRTRASVADQFGTTEQMVDSGGADGDMLADGSAVVLTTGPASDVIVLRECI